MFSIQLISFVDSLCSKSFHPAVSHEEPTGLFPHRFSDGFVILIIRIVVGQFLCGPSDFLICAMSAWSNCREILWSEAGLSSASYFCTVWETTPSCLRQNSDHRGLPGIGIRRPGWANSLWARNKYGCTLCRFSRPKNLS